MYLDYISASFVFSFLFCLILIFLDKKAAEAGDKNLRNSPQTLHIESVSRFGGVAIVFSMGLIAYFAGYNWSNSMLMQVGILSLPAFIVGFLDDLKFLIHPFFRLLMLLPVPIMYFYYFDLKVIDLNLGFLDDFLQIEFFAVLFLCFAIVGMINAFNLVDGINGLLSTYLISILIALAIVESATGTIFSIDEDFRLHTNILLGSILGFMVLNYPYGKIFLGDAGAYYLGAISCFGIIYTHLENDNSPWVVMCVLAYPFTDLAFSVFRKKVIMGGDPLQPDALHLHHVVYKRFRKLKFKKDNAKHFFTVIFISIFNLPYLCLSLYFNNNTAVLITIFFAYILSYLSIYFALNPRFLMSNGK